MFWSRLKRPPQQLQQRVIKLMRVLMLKLKSSERHLSKLLRFGNEMVSLVLWKWTRRVLLMEGKIVV